MLDAGPEVAVDEDGGVGAPHQAAGEEGGDQHEAVVELGAGAGHAQLVEEPVDVEEGRGELPEDEDGTVVVDEWPLFERHDARC